MNSIKTTNNTINLPANFNQSQANLYIKDIEGKQAEVVQYQLASKDSPVFPLKTEQGVKNLELSIQNLRPLLENAATTSEIQSAINELFIILAKQGSNNTDLKIEMGIYLKHLQGYPLWVINEAVFRMLRKETFRSVSKLIEYIEEVTTPVSRKIRIMQRIRSESLKTIAKEKELEKIRAEGNTFAESLRTAAENGSEIAQDYLKKQSKIKPKEATKEYKKCNNLGENLLNKHNIAKKD